MKMPKQIKTICPFCRKHTLQKVYESKKRAASALTRGARAKLRVPGHGGKGRFSRPPIGDWKLTGWNTPRRDLRLECSVCKKSHTRKKSFRAKKFELVSAQ